MATYYFRSTGTNWGTAGDWSSTPSPSYTAGAVPTTADDAVFEAASANCIINAGATRNCLNLTCTSYTGTLTFNTNLTVLGNVTLGSASMTMAGSSTLALTPGTTLALSSGGCVCAVPMSITRSTGTATLTFSSNWTQSGSFTLSGTTIWTFNGFTLTLKGSSVAWNNVATIGGTTALLFAPDLGTTTTVTSSTGARWGFASVTINGAGSINLNLDFTLSTNIVFTYTAGTVTHTGLVTLSSTTLNTNGMSFQNGATINVSNTTTLTSDVTFTGSFTIPSSLPTINPAGRNVYIGGSFTNNNTGGTPPGLANLVMNGTGNVIGTSTFALTNPLIINTSGTITFSGSISWLRTLTFTAGTIVSTGSTISCNSSSTFTINGTGFNLSTFTTSSSATFAGTEGFTIGTFTAQTAGTTQTFSSGDTYTITTALNLLGTVASALTFKSSSSGSQATVNLNFGASLDVGHVTATDINSSGGRTIWVYKGTIGAQTVNWQQLPTVPKTVGETWVR